MSTLDVAAGPHPNRHHAQRVPRTSFKTLVSARGLTHLTVSVKSSPLTQSKSVHDSAPAPSGSRVHDFRRALPCRAYLLSPSCSCCSSVRPSALPHPVPSASVMPERLSRPAPWPAAPEARSTPLTVA